MAFDQEEAAEDARVMQLYAAGDPVAPRLMSERFLPATYRFALRQLGNPAEAEDVAQEAMIRLFRAAPGWQAEGARVTSWLYRVVANLCLDRQRRARARGPHLQMEAAEAVADHAPGAEVLLTESARLGALDRALASLPDRQRMALVLRHIEGLPNPEIARIMGVGPEAVESLTARGKRALQAALAGQKEALGYGDE
ncbi:MAG: sigma-70 family RNA polymerase sigma factor [Paracoccaceae bacterium]